MRRNVVKHGPSTLTVSLPSSWVKKNSICSGAVMDVQEKGSQLVLNIKKEDEVVKMNVDVKDNLKTGIRYINCAYRKGCDELVMYYSKPAYLERIEKCLSEEMLGFEIVKHGKEGERNFCVIKDVSGTKCEEFDTLIERIWLIIVSMSEDLINAIESKDKKSIGGFKNLDTRVNKFTNLCCRILNKHGHPLYKNIPVYYRFLRGLEELSDYYKYIAIYYSEKDIKISNEFIEILKKLNENLKLFNKLFYKPSDELVEKLLIETATIYPILVYNVEKNLDYQLNHLLFGINNKIRSLTSAIIEMNILN